MGAVKPAFGKHGLAFIQVCHDSENAVKVETLIVHSSGEQISAGCVSVPINKHDAQGYGSALTYARRYSLAAAAGVGAEDDDGNAAVKAAPQKVVPPKVEPEPAGKATLMAAKSAEELAAAWKSLHPDSRATLVKVKDEMKAALCA